MLKAEVFSQEKFKSAVAPDFVLIKLNTEHNSAIARKYNIRVIPTVVFLNAEGQEVRRFTGAKSFSDVMKEVRAAKSEPE